jgi:hypothetical protein
MKDLQKPSHRKQLRLTSGLNLQLDLPLSDLVISNLVICLRNYHRHYFFVLKFAGS